MQLFYKHYSQVYVQVANKYVDKSPPLYIGENPRFIASEIFGNSRPFSRFFRGGYSRNASYLLLRILIQVFAYREIVLYINHHSTYSEEIFHLNSDMHTANYDIITSLYYLRHNTLGAQSVFRDVTMS